MELTDKIWQELEAGYKLPYDASIPLMKLEQTNDPEIIKNIWDELWNELHHQGDVGLASYLSLPQLVRISKTKNLFEINLLGLCCIIEQQRHLESNPVLPLEFQEYYYQGLAELKQLTLENIKQELDDTTYLLALSTLATCSGRIKLGRAIMKFESEATLDEFLEQF